MYKKINTIVVVFLAVLLITSCEGNFLDVNPTAKISRESVWKDSTLVQAYAVGLYTGIPVVDKEGESQGPGLSGRGFQYATMATLTDNAIYNHDDGTWSIIRGQLSPTNMGMLGGIWGRSYRSIRACNVFLNHIENVEMSKKHKRRLIAEVKFIRAFRYFNLLRNFGGIPLHGNKVYKLDDNLQNPEMYQRATIEETVDYIVSQLDEATQYLPLHHSSNWKYGRATKGAALTLKATTLLYAASPLYTEGANSQEKWTKAAQTFKTVMELGIYSLYPNYRKLFLTPYDNSEIIFQRLYTKKHNHLPFVKTNGPNGYSGWGGVNPLQNLVSEYEMKNGLPITHPNSGYNSQHPYKNRDPRLNATILHNGSEFKGREVQTFVPGGKDGPDGISAWNTSQTGYYLFKFMNPNLSTTTNVWNQSSDGPWIYFRYAEVLLGYAEARNEASGPDPSVYRAVNKVRNRVGMPDLPKGLSQNEMRKAIRHERRIELAFEGNRFYDVRRWKIAMKTGNQPAYGIKVTKNSDGSFTYKRVTALSDRQFKEKMYWLPIPHEEILASDGKLEQNPGY